MVFNSNNKAKDIKFLNNVEYVCVYSFDFKIQHICTTATLYAPIIILAMAIAM